MERLKIEHDESKLTYYLPHHAVVKEESLTTKVRVVFDASAKSSTGVSLNQLQLVGPKIQDDLFDILLRFRSYHVVITADIARMYRQIKVAEEDRDLQRIVWRETTEEPIRIYRLNTLTYGTASAPFLATRVLKQLAIEDGKYYPDAKNALERDFYMDDVLTGTQIISKAIILRRQLTELLGRGQFPLRKWRSNSMEVLQDIGSSNEDQYLLLNKHESGKTLGLLWNAKQDKIAYTVNIEQDRKITKRTILSKIGKIYDPLGLIGPVITIAKQIMQQLWQLKLDWDESIPQNIHSLWLTYYNSIEKINQLQISRKVIAENETNHLEIHGYADASERAYGACIYVRSKDRKGKYHVHLLCAKSRVAPLKTLSIPRLELNGAVLLARLTLIISKAFPGRISKKYLWSDSTIVLSWIKTSPHQLKTYVAHRVCEIQQGTEDCEWLHVSSQDNPADLLSRGITAEQLISNNLWWYGPSWLMREDWPNQPQCFEPVNLELKKITLMVLNDTDILLKKYSSIVKLQRIIAFIRRFIYNCKNAEKAKGSLTVLELENATICILQMLQRETFKQDLKQLLEEKQTVNKKSKLNNLKPFLDDNLLIRVGGRLSKSKLPIDQKHPIILPKDHQLTKLIMENKHKQMHHCGSEQLLAAVRLKYWPLSGRKIAKNITRNCITCFKYKPVHSSQQMGDLPTSRLNGINRPFATCGIDFAGPIKIKENRSRGRKIITKGYVAVFVCFLSKAVHLELVSNLTTEMFLAAFRRFVSRRGLCKDIHSDNATNFVGANSHLREIYEFMKTNKTIIQEELAKQQIQWHFIPARSPHFGGLWEAAVKSMKTHLFKVTNNLSLTFEECYTFLTEIEAILNSRPITALSTDPLDLLPLCPSHFLIGDTMLSVPEISTFPSKFLSRWQHIQQMKLHFWKRWYREYLNQLQTRPKWQSSFSNIEVGALVLLIDNNLPPLKWSMGRVVNVHPGNDGVVRVVTVRTSNGIFKRAIKKVCALPIPKSE